MKQKPLEYSLAGLLLVIGFGIVLHAPLTVWLGTMYPAQSELIKSWKELLMGAALLLLIAAMVRRKMAGEFLQDRLVQIAAVYAALHVLMMEVLPHDWQSAGAGLLIDLRYVLYFVLVYGTVRLLPEFRRWFLSVIVGGALVVIGFGVLQIFVLPPDFLSAIGYGKDTIEPYITVDQNPNFIRINSTLRGPNPLGAYAVIMLTLLFALAVKRGKKLDADKRWLMGASAVAAGLVLGATYSRSALLALLVTLIVVVGMVSTAKRRSRLGLIAGIGAIVIVTVLSLLQTNPAVSSVVLHNDPTTMSAVDSDQQHAQSLASSIKNAAVQPLGAGVGTTGSASLTTAHPLIIENQYLFVAHEIGWIGLGLYVWLFVEIMKRLWQRRDGVLSLGVFAAGCGLAVIGLILPVWADDTVSIIWWGLAAVAVGGVYGARKSH